jgi:hypothetical protein
VPHVIFAFHDAGNVSGRLLGAEDLQILRSHPTVIVEINGWVGEDKRERMRQFQRRLQYVQHDCRDDVASPEI